MSGLHFRVSWKDFNANIANSFQDLLHDKTMADVTLTAEGKVCLAHRLVLAISSNYFKNLFQENTVTNQIVVLSNVPFSHLEALLEFMYTGQVDILEDNLVPFLNTADKLGVKGLSFDTTQS